MISSNNHFNYVEVIIEMEVDPEVCEKLNLVQSRANEKAYLCPGLDKRVQYHMREITHRIYHVQGEYVDTGADLVSQQSHFVQFTKGFYTSPILVPFNTQLAD